ISDLMSLDVREVWVRGEDGVERRVPIEQVGTGMLVEFHAGEKIVVDGSVVEGEAAVDQAAITGESAPATKRLGDKVYAGSVVDLGEILIKVEKVGDDTSLARIVHMVEDAQNRRAPIQSYADTMAASLVPVSFIAALVVFAVTRDVQRVLNMLFIDFSCGLKLSTATAISAAISRAAKSGILVKGGSFIEAASGVETIILDKTGTITRGRPSIVKIGCAEGIPEQVVLQMAASAEMHSSHPLAVAIMDEVSRRGLAIPPHDDTRTVIARGIEARIPAFAGFAGGEVLVGSAKLMAERGVPMGLAFEKSSPSGTLIHVAANGSLVGTLEISDPIRPEFKRALNRLRYAGIDEIVMITGDNKDAAKSIADSLGLDGYVAEVLPEDKASFVAEKQRVSNVIMVGDGINDAPALAYADVGVAMGSGCTDTALESADVTINSDDPLKLPELVDIGRETMRIVHQNFGVTIIINTAAMMAGALGIITPVIASVIHNASTLGVVLNSGRVLLDPRRRRGN
ncbi:MAG: heavy metal translocating P-type ATPase, partial [Succinivibrionaceae bacterium]|nr:heavy metal translocating P-type ATPase [Succinivibrionaceae bacterium]